MPIHGRSYTVRGSGTTPATTWSSGGVVDPRPRAIRASGTTPYRGIGHAGSHGQSMVVRVPGAGGCLDAFSRTVADGWDTPGWCLPGWVQGEHFSGGETRLSVDGSVGRINLTYDPDDLTVGVPVLDFTHGPAWDGTLSLRVRWSGNEAAVDSYSLQVAEAWLSPTSIYGDATSIILAFYRESGVITIQPNFWENRGLGGGAWYYADAPGWSWVVSAATLHAWWNLRFRVDAYGSYMRAWADGEDEFGHSADTQPEDEFGPDCPQGGGEAWQNWQASDAVLGEARAVSRLGIHMVSGVQTIGTLLEVDNVRVTGELCPCD